MAENIDWWKSKTTTANSTTDTLSIAGGTSIGTSVSGDTLTITNQAPNVDQNLFNTIAVSGQSDVIADTTTDTLTFVAGSNITTLHGVSATYTISLWVKLLENSGFYLFYSY